jgi:hypothetical protein
MDRRPLNPSGASELDWAWLAGIWEGEGTAGLWGQKDIRGLVPDRLYLRVTIAQRETTMLSEVHRIAGVGTIHKITSASRKGSVLFIWQCACTQARTFLTQLLLYVRSHHKRQQILVTLASDVNIRRAGKARSREANRLSNIRRFGPDGHCPCGVCTNCKRRIREAKQKQRSIA